jgi:hypothetical protein
MVLNPVNTNMEIVPKSLSWSSQLSELFDQAVSCPFCLRIIASGKICYFFVGIKICKDLNTNEIHIYNTHNGEVDYQELTPDQYNYFFSSSWMRACCYIALASNLIKIDRLNKRLLRLSKSADINAKIIKKLTLTKQQRELFCCSIRKY